MANICENELVITSDPTGKFGKLLLDIEQDIYDGVDGYPIFEVISHGDGYFMFQSKWSPPVDWLLSLQKDIPFTCTIKYHEFGCQSVGEVTIHEDGHEYTELADDYWYGLYSIWDKEVFINEVLDLQGYPDDEKLMEITQSAKNSDDTKYKALVAELLEEIEKSK